jgi:hypothetical protein
MLGGDTTMSFRMFAAAAAVVALSIGQLSPAAGFSFSFSPSGTIDFGSVADGGSKTLDVTATFTPDPGGAVHAWVIEFPTGPFSESDLCGGAVLSCTMHITFSPVTGGHQTGSLGGQVLEVFPPDLIDVTGINMPDISLSGTGVAVAGAPGPVVGAGLPGLIVACGGLLALRRRRQRVA